MISTLSFDRPFPSATILVPPVRLSGGRLRFQAEGPLELTAGQSGRLIFDFANLAEAPEQAFLDFAKVWGVLGFCPHGESIHHRSPPCLPRRIGLNMSSRLLNGVDLPTTFVPC
jgi:hypothetical protein